MLHPFTVITADDERGVGFDRRRREPMKPRQTILGRQSSPVSGPVRSTSTFSTTERARFRRSTGNGRIRWGFSFTSFVNRFRNGFREGSSFSFAGGLTRTTSTFPSSEITWNLTRLFPVQLERFSDRGRDRDLVLSGKARFRFQNRRPGGG
jgi:hypothetical protein